MPRADADVFTPTGLDSVGVRERVTQENTSLESDISSQILVLVPRETLVLLPSQALVLVSSRTLVLLPSQTLVLMSYQTPVLGPSRRYVSVSMSVCTCVEVDFNLHPVFLSVLHLSSPKAMW